MNPISTTVAPSAQSIFSDALKRAHDLLTSDLEHEFGHDAPLVGALNLAGRALGRPDIHSHGPLPNEAFDDAMERICRTNDLLMRPITLGNNQDFDSPCPVIAIRKSDGAPITILQASRRWTAVDPATGVHVALDNMMEDFEPRAFMIYPAFPNRPMKPRELVMFGAYRSRYDIGSFFLMMMLTGVIAAALPIASQWVIADIIPGHETALMVQIVVLLALLFGANLATRLAGSLAQLRIDGRVGSMIRFAAADRCVQICARDKNAPSAPVAAFSARSMATWHQGVWHLLLSVLASVLIATPSLLVVARSAPVAAGLVALAAISAVGLAYWIARRQYKAMMKGRAGPMSWMVSSFETLSEIETVRSYAAEERFFSRWSEGFMALREKFLRGDRTACGIHAVNAGLEAMLVLVAITGIYILHKSAASSAETVAFVMAVITVAGTATALIGSFAHVSMLALQKRLITPLLEGHALTPHHTKPTTKISGEIAVRNVSYRHQANGPLVLDDVSIDVKPGEHIGIAGPSGSGKSTLMRAILGLIEPESGDILYDCRSLSELDIGAIRRQCGVVGQSGRLFPGSLFDNISLGSDITRADAWHALHLAGIADDVRQMPLGLATPIGDANPTLSGGQIQRILLARALANKPKLILLDEATSALDPKAQARVQASLTASEASIISIAHRLETLRNCDRIYVLDGGRVAESGTYEALINRDGLFAHMITTERQASAPARSVAQDALNRIMRELSPTTD